jgi:putative oxidoreductase
MSNKPSTALHIGLWVVQVLLALMFLMAGVMKSTQPPEALIANGMSFVGYSPLALVRFIGVSEFLGGVGLILPSALRILPWLTPAAAGGLVVIMALAGGMHVVNGEPGLPVNVVIGALAAFVVWGRLAGAPITARNAA